MYNHELPLETMQIDRGPVTMQFASCLLISSHSVNIHVYSAGVQKLFTNAFANCL